MPQIFRVEKEDHGVRLDKFLATKIQDISRSRLQELIEQGFVRVDQKNSGASSKVKEGQLIDVTIPPLIDAHPLPQNIPLDILYEDDDVVVLGSGGAASLPGPSGRRAPGGRRSTTACRGIVRRGMNPDAL